MKNLILLPFALLCLSTTLFAQKVGDVIYYNAKWKTVSTKDSAAYFRTIEKKAKGLTYVTDHFISGKPQMTGSYSSFNPDVKDGEFVFYREGGNKSSDNIYKHGKLNGKCQDFYPNGTVHYAGTYNMDLLEGTFVSYFPNGKMKRVEEYSKNEVIHGMCYTITGADTTYRPYMVQPDFKGGQDSLGRYIMANLHYPQAARKNNITGKVFISFIVNKDGTISDFTVSKKVHPLLDEAALAIVKTMPTWKPGLVDDEPQRFSFSIPINFALK